MTSRSAEQGGQCGRLHRCHARDIGGSGLPRVTLVSGASGGGADACLARGAFAGRRLLSWVSPAVTLVMARRLDAGEASECGGDCEVSPDSRRPPCPTLTPV